MRNNFAHPYIDSNRWKNPLTSLLDEAVAISEKVGRLDFVAIESMHLPKIISYNK